MTNKWFRIHLLSMLLSCCCIGEMWAQDTFVLGGDMSWLTKQEKEGKKFRTAEGQVCDGMEMFAALGMQAVRLRVWVNPADKWDGADDVLAKAKRAKAAGQQLMIDFHYSDTWADPSHQTKPKAWGNYTVQQLADAVASHTSDVLTLLKDNDIDVAWVQVGNEITNGMLWPSGKLSDGATSAKNCAKFFKAGSDAVKEIYPSAKVVLHISGGEDLATCKWSLDLEKNNGAVWDITGVSFYPDAASWKSSEQQVIANIKELKKRYGKPVMMCETGIEWNSAEAENYLTTLRTDLENLGTDVCPGVFYWEPDGHPGYNYYNKGAVTSTGKPTVAIQSFYRSSGSTAVQTVNSSQTKQPVYTIDGRRVTDADRLQRGLYIIGNTKVMVK